MPGPFKLFGNLFLAGFKIAGYFVVCIAQAIWYAAARKPDKIGDAFGYFGRGTVDAISDIFK
jgi:hypothetical protein